jgi:hypothetical protein
MQSDYRMHPVIKTDCYETNNYSFSHSYKQPANGANKKES